MADVAPDHNGGTPPEVVRQGRLPRWTRQEILVLIQGKRVAETGTRRGRAAAAGLGIGTGQIETKWVSVSSYCRRHGVNRGPVQCRKRWSNLAGDYKKIKEWEGTAAARDGNKSFWAMRNDARREQKLPGFFDREVYDILERGAAAEGEGMEAREEDSAAVVFDSGRSAAADDGLFSGDEMEVRDGDGDSRMVGGSGGTSDHKAMAAAAAAAPISGGTENQPVSGPEIGSSSQDPRKRKRFAVEEEGKDCRGGLLGRRMVDALERNSRLISGQLEAQNHSLQLERDQRKSQTDGLLAVLNRLVDALGRIADKL